MQEDERLVLVEAGQLIAGRKSETHRPANWRAESFGQLQ